MYYYLYDTFLNDKKYDKVLDQIKTRLLDLEIQGKHERLSLLKSADVLIEDESKRGTKTVVIVGNDKSFLRAVDVAARTGVTLGLIPVGDHNEIAKHLGIPSVERACEILSARKLVNFDLGQVNNLYFFTSIKITKNIERISVVYKGCRLTPNNQCSEVAVVNANFLEKNLVGGGVKKINPQDKLLDLIVKKTKVPVGWKKYLAKDKKEYIDTQIASPNFEIKSFEYLPILLDDFKVIKTPVSVRLADKQLQVIVGKTPNLKS